MEWISLDIAYTATKRLCVLVGRAYLKSSTSLKVERSQVFPAPLGKRPANTKKDRLFLVAEWYQELGTVVYGHRQAAVSSRLWWMMYPVVLPTLPAPVSGAWVFFTNQGLCFDLQPQL